MIAGNAVTMCIAVAVSVIALGGNSVRIDWQDANLEVAMREITEIQTGDIMLSDVWEITSLDLTERGTSNISALSGLTNLIELSLVNNNISDYSPVSFVPNLNY